MLCLFCASVVLSFGHKKLGFNTNNFQLVEPCSDFRKNVLVKQKLKLRSQFDSRLSCYQVTTTWMGVRLQRN